MSAMTSGNQSIRDGVKQSADPRVTRTRTAVRDAVGMLSDAGAELSVASIARAAGISRATFYSHYASLDELANSLHREAFALIGNLYLDDRHKDPDALRLSQARLVDHFVQNRAFYAAVAAMPVSKDSYLAGVRAMAAVIEDSLAEHLSTPAGLNVTATSRYIAGAAYGLLDAWIGAELDLTAGELVDHLLRLLPPWFSSDR